MNGYVESLRWLALGKCDRSLHTRLRHHRRARTVFLPHIGDGPWAGLSSQEAAYDRSGKLVKNLSRRFAMLLRKWGLRSLLITSGLGIAFALFFLCYSFGSLHTTSIDKNAMVDKQYPSGKISLSARSFKLGDPIPFKFYVTNIGTRPMEYWVTEFCTDHQIILRNSTGHAPQYTPEGLRWQSQFGTPSRRGNVAVYIEPSKSYMDDPGRRLDELYVLKPGWYTLRVMFVHGSSSFRRQLTTQFIEFSIEM